PSYSSIPKAGQFDYAVRFVDVILASAPFNSGKQVKPCQIDCYPLESLRESSSRVLAPPNLKQAPKRNLARTAQRKLLRGKRRTLFMAKPLVSFASLATRNGLCGQNPPRTKKKTAAFRI